MNMDNRYLKKVELDKVLEMLIDCAAFSLSQEKALQLEPFNSAAKAQKAIDDTTEAVNFLRLYPAFTIGGARDIREILRRAELGGILDVSELVAIADTCRASRQSRALLTSSKGDFPVLMNLAKALGYFKTIESAVEKSITPEMTVADTASERLYQIRQKINQQQNRLKERLDNFIKNQQTAKYLQEPIVTIRGDRYVVPVKQEFRSHVPGIVHDSSASGATIFVEPLGAVEANNELTKLHSEEEMEIAAILRALTMVVLTQAEELRNTLGILAQLDFIMAKGRLSEKMRGEPAKINEKGYIDLRKARHPLISGEVVPIDVRLPANTRVMVITGPNTGGKTVTLKTVGLLTLMSLCGLHIPAASGSEVAFYSKFFADIGDEQSIEQSLSTFSSHMTNIVRILEEADNETLVILDELGSGTDPTEGAALAMSILEYLFNIGAKILATTHYSELKTFAYNRPGFINASVEFDVQSLCPTYRLIMGLPGKSNAFEIAARLGLDAPIIEQAASFLSNDDLQVSDLIMRLENDSLEASKAREEADNIKKRLLLEEEKFKEQEIELHNREAEIIRRANQESLRLVQETKAEMEHLYKELKNNSGTNLHKDMQEARESLKKREKKLFDTLPEDQYAGIAPRTVEPGQLVEIPKLQQKGQVLSVPDDNEDLLVQIGIMKVTVNLADLRLYEEKNKMSGQVYKGNIHSNKAKDIKPEIDLRGMTVDEAIEKLDKYIDDSFLGGLKQLRVIHGKGTGALRAGLLDYLKSHRLVKEYQQGDYYDGGLGVTIVTLNL